MNNSISFSTEDNSVVITSGNVVQQFPVNSLAIIADNTDVINLRTIGSRKNIVSFVWRWLEGATSKANAIELVASYLFA